MTRKKKARKVKKERKAASEQRERVDALPVGAQDQLDAATRDARKRVLGDAAVTSGIVDRYPDGRPPPALDKIGDLYGECVAGWRAGTRPEYVCPHKQGGQYRAEVTHWFAAHPDARVCDACGTRAMEAFMRDHHCDLCGKDFDPPWADDHPPVNKVWLPVQHIILHASLCDGCYPEGSRHAAPAGRGAGMSTRGDYALTGEQPAPLTAADIKACAGIAYRAGMSIAQAMAAVAPDEDLPGAITFDETEAIVHAAFAEEESI